MNQTPDGRRFIVQASAEDSQGRWTVTLERERYNHSNQEQSRIEAQARERLGVDRPLTLSEVLQRY